MVLESLIFFKAMNTKVNSIITSSKVMDSTNMRMAIFMKGATKKT